ncbi:MAG: hypothetical protein MJ197_00670 [Bacteroidales bacterium]|nr:hypothetical protein [Bacteroidales bacterium]
MKKTFRYKKQTFRFHRWNRANYSAFMSIGKQITIGRVNTEVADGLLRDQHIKEIFTSEFMNGSSDDDDSSGGDENILTLLEQTILCPTQLTTEACPASCKSSYFVNSNPIFWWPQSIGFFIFKSYEKNQLAL